MVALLHNQVSGNTLRTRPTSFSWEFGAGFGTMLFTGIIGAGAPGAIMPPLNAISGYISFKQKQIHTYICICQTIFRCGKR